MRGFDRILVLDWSAAARPSPPRPSADAVWIGEARAGAPPGAVTAVYHRTRAAAMADLAARIEGALAAGERLLVGADFAMGYPAGFARGLTGREGALAVWDWLAAAVEDGPDNANNRFAVAAAINARFPGIGPFWGCPPGLALPGLPARGRLCAGHGLPARREAERRLPVTQPVWKLYTAGAVGSQAILGIAAFARLRSRLGGRLAVWPLEPWEEAAAVAAEVYPSLLRIEVAAAAAGAGPGAIRDALQVQLLAAALARLAGEGGLGPLLAPEVPRAVLAEEGWILGAGRAETLRAALGAPPAAPRQGRRAAAAG